MLKLLHATVLFCTTAKVKNNQKLLLITVRHHALYRRTAN